MITNELHVDNMVFLCLVFTIWAFLNLNQAQIRTEFFQKGGRDKMGKQNKIYIFVGIGRALVHKHADFPPNKDIPFFKYSFPDFTSLYSSAIGRFSKC